MKRMIRIVILVGAASLNFSQAYAYKHPSHKNEKPSTPVTQKAGCAPASKSIKMEFNDISALIEQGGSMFQNRQNGTPAYGIFTPNNDGPKVIYSGALWMGGTDVNGQLKLAAITYRNGNDFWPGPLTVNPNSPANYDPLSPVGDDVVRQYGDANIDQSQCTAYDEMFLCTKSLVVRFNANWECNAGIVTDGCDEIQPLSSEELDIITNWPAHGDVTLNQDFYLAPFYDRDQNGLYEPDNGDHPWYDDILGRDDIECGVDRRISLFGDQTYWWVFNDKGNIHSETQGEPIGMEIRAQAFAFSTSDEINRMTFYNYELINRGTQTLYNTYFAQWLDPDVGNYVDDFVGCDVSRGLGYAFNGDLDDETSGGNLGHGSNPPAIGCDFFEGPYQDADDKDNPGPYYDTDGVLQTPTIAEAMANDGIVYRGIGIGYGDNIVDNERFGMRRFTYFTGPAAYPYSDPNTAAEYYNFMEGQWANGEEMYYGGTGNTVTGNGMLSDYMFPGDSDPLHWSTGGQDPGFDWDEVQAGNAPNDRRFVQAAGPFTLRPGAVNNLTVGIVYGRSYDGGLWASVEAMKRADTKAQALFDNCFRILPPPDAPKLSIQELENHLILTLENPITSNNYKEGYSEVDDINIPDTYTDEERSYVFEGYQIYQMVDEVAGVGDITDNNKARLVAQCDIKNDIDRIINFEFDEELGFSVPTEKVDGANEGIKHSFKVTEDLFAQGDRALVNHKTYYYVAIAYGYNQFKEYDPNDPLLLDGQKLPYLPSRISYDGTSIKPVAGVPHNPVLESGGTLVPAEYGVMPRITRIDGHGNGNLGLELTEASRNTILSTGLMAEPEYETNGGPIGVKVVDPLNVTGGYYECKFRDYTKVPNEGGADTASWTIYRYTSKGGSIIDSVRSDMTIKVDNEQLIPDWGISVQIKQEKYFFPVLTGNMTAKITTPISSSLTHKDSNNLWLGLISDVDGYTPFNWIRSGTNNPSSDPTGNGCDDNLLAYDPCDYDDEQGVDNDKIFTKILNGGVAPHRLVGYQGHFMPLAYPPIYTAFQTGRKNASISFSPSVDIVITSDKSKWTRCPVIELGRDVNLAVGGAKAGEMRKSQSVDKNGNPDGTGTGMGWFPGYAIDLETGARLHMAFGEHSFLGADGGADMVWNPSSRLFNSTGDPIMGGVQPIWVFGTNQKTINVFTPLADFPNYNPATDETSNYLQSQMAIVENPASSVSARNNAGKAIYGNLCWIVNPITLPGKTFMSSDVTIKVRMNKEYKDYAASGKNGGKPMYGWSMDELATTTGNTDLIADALKDINIVPNPYYAFSEYERTRLDTRVKITNLPDQCTINIYSSNGKLVRSFKKDSPITSVDWDLNNFKGIPVAGGIYLIHVDVPGVGERVLKFFGGMRQVDLQGL